MFGLLSLSNPLLRWAGALLLAAIIIWGYGEMKYNAGYSMASAESKLLASIEQTRQAEINVKAQQALLSAHTQYLHDLSGLEKTIEDNQREAQSDPDATTGGISASSVLRLNRLAR